MFSRRVVLSVLNIGMVRSDLCWSPWLQASSQRSVSSDHLDVGRRVSLQSDALSFISSLCFLLTYPMKSFEPVSSYKRCVCSEWNKDVSELQLVSVLLSLFLQRKVWDSRVEVMWSCLNTSFPAHDINWYFENFKLSSNHDKAALTNVYNSSAVPR
jgi:hypothetical protein